MEKWRWSASNKNCLVWHGIEAYRGKPTKMKLTLVITCLMISLTSLASSKEPKKPVHILANRMDCLYLKVEKEMIGAKIEVYSRKGEQLISQTVTKSRALIDFYYEDPGNFTVKITKGDIEISFDYVKRTPSPLIPIEIERVSITQ